MSSALIERLHGELDRLPLVDPHTHINPHAPASTTLADILGYHYYTELAHSAGLPREQIEGPEVTAREKVARLATKLPDLENTIQHHWLLEMCREFFGFQENSIHPGNWETLYNLADKKMSSPNWEQQVLDQSRLLAVFLTNDFDDPLTGFDTKKYVPCLRTDDLVFHLTNPAVQARLKSASAVDVRNPATLRQAVGQLFEHFHRNGAKACAISLPPDFSPAAVTDTEVAPIFEHLTSATDDEKKLLSQFVFWTLAEFCAEFKLPFDLMIGVNRKVYPAGVYQGQDLFDQRTSLIQYRALFNAFPQVTFPISVLSHAANQELVSYSWIFPNVVTNGHWWYSNIPAYIENDCRSRLQAVPQTKQIGYYSDMYKLEFALPKFGMYRRTLAKVLAEDFVIARGWSEDKAVQLGKTTLRDNVQRIFGV